MPTEGPGDEGVEPEHGLFEQVAPQSYAYTLLFTSLQAPQQPYWVT